MLKKSHKSAKITVTMLFAVCCLFAVAACGNTGKDTTDTTQPATEEKAETDTTKSETETETESEKTKVTLNLSSPQTDSLAEGGVVNVSGTVDNSPNPGKDKIKMELTADGKKIGEAESLVSDLDSSFSAELRYELTDTLNRDDDNTVKATLRVYMEDDTGDDTEKDTLAEATVALKLK